MGKAVNFGDFVLENTIKVLPESMMMPALLWTLSRANEMLEGDGDSVIQMCYSHLTFKEVYSPDESAIMSLSITPEQQQGAFELLVSIRSSPAGCRIYLP